MISPEILSNEGRKEVSQIRVIEEITRNVKVVEIDGRRKYQVIWRAGTVGLEGKESFKKGEPVVCYFETAQQVIHQHERVLEGYLGTEIPLAAGKILAIPGETQKMARISQELSSLASQFVIPFTSQSSAQLKERVLKIKEEIGRVTNEYKQKAQFKLGEVFFSQDERKASEATFLANLAILKRAEECLDIVGGTNSRLRRVVNKKAEWEETISQIFYDVAQIVKDLESGVYAGHPRKREQLARHISGQSGWSLAGKLSQISGPEYWQRIQTREVQGLWRVGELLRVGKDEEAKRVLITAILKLERVVKEKAKQEQDR